MNPIVQKFEKIKSLINNNNIKIVELPILWVHRSGSKVNLIKDSIKFFLDLLLKILDKHMDEIIIVDGPYYYCIPTLKKLHLYHHLLQKNSGRYFVFYNQILGCSIFYHLNYLSLLKNYCYNL